LHRTKEEAFLVRTLKHSQEIKPNIEIERLDTLWEISSISQYDKNPASLSG
jgi:hypothetical protein